MKKLSLAWTRKPKPYFDVIGDCMICTSHKPSKRGYPRVNRNHQPVNISRLVFFRRYGQQSSEVKARHTCDDPLCINPDHIVPGSQADNVRDCVSRGRNHKGERTGGAILTENNIVEIRKLINDGMIQREIAARFGVIRQNISRIKLRQTWNHVA